MTVQRAQVTIRIEGPMKRSTFQRESPDPVEQAMSDLLHWSWSTRLQIRRLARSLRAEFDAWGGRPRLKSRRCFSATSYDEHLVFVAAANLQRALESAPRPLRGLTRGSNVPNRQLRLLRDIYEHWDQLRRQFRADPAKLRGAARRLRDEFPNADPWSFTFDPQTGDIVLAGVVGVKALLKELRLLEARVLRRERAGQKASRTRSDEAQSKPTAV